MPISMVKTGFQVQLPESVIRLAKEGEIAAFEKIYSTYINASYNLAYRLTYNEAVAEDITQSVYLKVFSSISNYDFKGSFAGWIRRIVVNESINQMKSKHQLSVVLDNEVADRESSSLFTAQWLVNAIDLEYYLGKLPKVSRIVIHLHEIEGYKHKEISGFFNKSESFSKMTLKRAYKELHMLLEIEEKQNAFK